MNVGGTLIIPRYRDRNEITEKRSEMLVPATGLG